MVLSRLFSILGRESYSTQTHGLLPLFCNNRHTTTSPFRHLRSKLPYTSTRSGFIDYRSYCSPCNRSPKKAHSPSSVTRQGSWCTSSSSKALRERAFTFHPQLRFQTRRLSLDA